MKNSCDDEKYDPMQREHMRKYGNIRDGNSLDKSGEHAGLVATSPYTFHLLQVISCQLQIPEHLRMEAFVLTVEKMRRTRFPITTGIGACGYLLHSLRNNANTVLNQESRRMAIESSGTDDLQEYLKQVPNRRSSDVNEEGIIHQFDDGTLVSILPSEFWGVIQSLPTDEQQCINMYTKKASYKELAISMNCSERRVSYLLTRARTKIEKILKRDYLL